VTSATQAIIAYLLSTHYLPRITEYVMSLQMPFKDEGKREEEIMVTVIVCFILLISLGTTATFTVTILIIVKKMQA
jgi:hypothetical protein